LESLSLQRGVWCEPGFWGRVPSMTTGTWRRVTDAATRRREGSGNVPVLPFLGLQRIKLMPAPRPVRWIGEGYASPLPPIGVSKSLRSTALPHKTRWRPRSHKSPKLLRAGRAGTQIGTGGRETLASITASWRTGSAASPRSVGFLARKGSLTGLHCESQTGKRSLCGRRARPSWSLLGVRS